MQQFREDAFLDEHLMTRDDREGAGGGQDEAGNVDENNDFFLEEVSDEVAPLLSDAERYWGSSAAPEMVVPAVEGFMAEFVEGLLRGQLADIELVRREREREREREKGRTGTRRTTVTIIFTTVNLSIPASFPFPTIEIASKQMPLASPMSRATKGPASFSLLPPPPPPSLPAAASSSTVLSLSSLPASRSSVRSFSRALRVSRLMLVLNIAHEALLSARTVTVRDVWYRLKGAGAARSPSDASAAVADAQTLLALPREALGLRAAPRGAVAGCLWIANEDGGANGGENNAAAADAPSSSSAFLDLRRVGPAGYALPGCPAAARALRVASDAAFLIIVEKDAVFERLVEDRVWEGIAGGAVLVTARGMPDLSTRAFCSHLLACCCCCCSPSSSSASSSSSSSTSSASARKPQMQVLGLCDWNPGGVALLTVYKYGSLSAAAAAAAPSPSLSARASLEGAAYALRSMRWLGARSAWFLRAGTRDEALQPLTFRDLGTARSLAVFFSPAGGGGGNEEGDEQGGGDFSSHQWCGELEAMAAAGVKAELEAMEDGEEGTGLGSLSAFVAEAANAGDWI